MAASSAADGWLGGLAIVLQRDWFLYAVVEVVEQRFDSVEMMMGLVGGSTEQPWTSSWQMGLYSVVSGVE